MRKQFDIKYRPQIESGEYKVETTRGQSVRIICWDRSTTYWKIIGLVLSPDGRTENPFTYDVNGKESDGCLHNHELDLFIVTPEEELNAWEKAVGRAIAGFQLIPRDNDGMHNIHDVDEFIKKNAAALLAIAEKEISNGHEHDVCVPEDTYYEQLKKQWEEGYDKGKAEAMKDLPRWIPNKFDKHNFETCKAYLDTPRYLCYEDKMIDVSELVEKLPGFKEDDSHE